MIQLPISHIGSVLDHNWNTAVNVIGPNDDLPLPDEIINFYGDFETTCEDPYKSSVNPHSESLDETSNNLHRDVKLLGFAFLYDDEKFPYYVPLRHYMLDEEGYFCYRDRNIPQSLPNYPYERFYDWIKKLFQAGRIKNWVNHNIRYDIHVLKNETGIVPRCKIIDTLNRSKLGPFEERFNYDLTTVLRLIGIDITPYELWIKNFLGKKYKDYGLIPPDRMAVYAAVDVLAVRKLYQFLESRRAKDQDFIIDLEDRLLPTLLLMEQVGVKLDIHKCVQRYDEIIPRQLQRIKYIKAKSGFDRLDPSKKKSQYEFFVEHLGLDLDFTATTKDKLYKGQITENDEDELNFSFGYDSLMRSYKKYPKIINAWNKYQEDEKLVTGFIIPYLEKHHTSHNLMHFSFNQIVRTGRLSCSKPNMTQNSARSKEFIVPFDEDYILVDFDLSQIEFRIIAHYIENQKTIEAYQIDPLTDFHDWVAKLCGIPRKPAKNINFMLGYGGGKEKCVKMLASLPEIVGNLASYDLIQQRALDVYNSYHRNLRELKPTSYRAAEVCRSKGFVKTMMGRRRNLPMKVAHKAFNSACQGSAADIFKYITVNRIRPLLSMDCLLHMLVHDSWVFSIRKSRAHEIIPEIKYQIERPIDEINLSVPLVCDFGTSAKNWRDCDNNKGKIAI